MTNQDKNAVSGVLAFTTTRYEEMAEFLRAIGMEVHEQRGAQLVPLFEHGRGAFVSRGDVSFNLEESTSGQTSTCFNLLLMGYSETELEQLSTIGYHHSTEDSLHGTHHTFTSPDGGRVTIGP